MKLKKVLGRRALLAAAACILLPLQAGAQTQWPNKPIKLVVPFAPGGSNDIIGRVLATKLGARWGQSVVVENKGGSGGTIGTDFVAKSVPDGYTLLFASTSITTNAASGKKLPYDLIQDLEPIGMVATSPFAVVVSNALKVNTLKEFIDLARKSPKSVNYGTAGIGGLNHLGTELLASAAKVELTHVPYKGIGPAFTDVMGGTLQMVLPTVASVVPHLQGGKMRGLAVTSTQRSPMLPDLPTAAEAGLPGFQLEVWFGLLGPARMPADLVKRINEDLNAVLATPEVKEILGRDGATPKPSTPEAFKTLVRSDLERWKNVIKDSKIILE